MKTSFTSQAHTPMKPRTFTIKYGFKARCCDAALWLCMIAALIGAALLVAAFSPVG